MAFYQQQVPDSSTWDQKLFNTTDNSKLKLNLYTSIHCTTPRLDSAAKICFSQLPSSLVKSMENRFWSWTRINRLPASEIRMLLKPVHCRCCIVQYRYPTLQFFPIHERDNDARLILWKNWPGNAKQYFPCTINAPNFHKKQKNQITICYHRYE